MIIDKEKETVTQWVRKVCLKKVDHNCNSPSEADSVVRRPKKGVVCKRSAR